MLNLKPTGLTLEDDELLTPAEQFAPDLSERLDQLGRLPAAKVEDAYASIARHQQRIIKSIFELLKTPMLVETDADEELEVIPSARIMRVLQARR